MKTNESRKGISLIVLIITILVMIIIAAAIILNIDDTKIINNAEKAASNNNLAAAKEIRVVARTEWRINEAKLREDGYKSFKDYLESKIDEAGLTNNVYITEKGEILQKYTDKNGDWAIIPEGFVASRATGEDTIDAGLVIYEGEQFVTDNNVEEAQTTRNQFVWVPVDNYERFERTKKYKPTDDITALGSNYSEPYTTSTYTSEEKEYLAMRASVKEYNGFYIARYEAGLPEGKTSATVTQADIPVSKKGATVWNNNIPWGKSMTEIGTEGAVYRARQMYKGSKSVVSTLCYGVQWDAALQFIATKDADYPTESTGKGNYTGSVLTSGYSEDYALNNIYDMAGNAHEWTMEAYSTYGRIVRGGSTYASGLVYAAYVRAPYNPENAYSDYGFRITLYLK